MADKKKQQTTDTVESIDNALTRTEQFIEQNQKSLTIIVAAILAIVAIYFGYKKLYLQPKENEASSQIFQAQYYFEQDSFRLALYGNENDLGFATIADRYGMTRTGNLANYYAGICLRELGEYQKAIDYLKKFDAGDQMVTPIAYGAIGDCYVELNKLKDAAKFYIKAANYEKNDFTTPIFLKKAGMVYEELKQYDKALDLYNIIKNDFTKSIEARDIEKDIARINTLMGK
ncbi:MAG: tetratricopeptide repeat protein [Tenuifilum sp.]|uniref:tetratricopeptide repeat protein n=1 Tax=Tenuifilum sp. TaxID=2760880 RepID=UPI001B61F426|nr:tetratricopeptide repeat protein [Bacteroidales bacterium]HOK61968.1 tetratricopeptide repeat protein [Tenuifilum sp.]MBP9028549.1 tetratricopeptide repeat protein [Bacteroidales bacterium]HOK86563.1 tetratricopeptide repeat protein [Tenuifilum sp.]HON71347.1 tetratricopeptide repeat protein [Tenuifilum sp.]